MVGSPTASSPSLSAGIVSTGGSIAFLGRQLRLDLFHAQVFDLEDHLGHDDLGLPGSDCGVGGGRGELGWGPGAACAMHGIAERASTKKTGATRSLHWRASLQETRLHRPLRIGEARFQSLDKSCHLVGSLCHLHHLGRSIDGGRGGLRVHFRKHRRAEELARGLGEVALAIEVFADEHLCLRGSLGIAFLHHGKQHLVACFRLLVSLVDIEPGEVDCGLPLACPLFHGQ